MPIEEQTGSGLERIAIVEPGEKLSRCHFAYHKSFIWSPGIECSEESNMQDVDLLFQVQE